MRVVQRLDRSDDVAGPAETELVREVTADDNTINFELESGGFEPTFDVQRR